MKGNHSYPTAWHCMVKGSYKYACIYELLLPCFFCIFLWCAIDIRLFASFQKRSMLEFLWMLCDVSCFGQNSMDEHFPKHSQSPHFDSSTCFESGWMSADTQDENFVQTCQTCQHMARNVLSNHAVQELNCIAGVLQLHCRVLFCVCNRRIDICSNDLILFMHICDMIFVYRILDLTLYYKI